MYMNKGETAADQVKNELQSCCDDFRYELRKTGFAWTKELQKFGEDMHRGFNSLIMHFDSIDNHIETIAEYNEKIIKIGIEILGIVFGVVFVAVIGIFVSRILVHFY